MTKNDYIFIIGIARTGSKIYMNIINSDDNVKIASEFRFSHPILFDIKRLIKKCNYLKTNVDVEKFIDELWDGNVKSTFWKKIENNNMNKKYLFDQIVNSKRDDKDILSSILETYKIGQNVKRIGAKFPVSVSDAPDLLKWFPNCKILHIVRDPRATASSNTKKWTDNLYEAIKRKIGFRIPKIIIKELLILDNVFSWLKAFEIHKKLKKHDNYFVMRFEDLVQDPEKYVNEICDYLDLKFDEKMLNPPVTDSSFNSKKHYGFDKNTIDRYKYYLSKFDIKWISFITKKKMEKYGYEDIE